MQMKASNSFMSNIGKDKEEKRERGGGVERSRRAVQPQIFQGAVLHIKSKWSHCKVILFVFIVRMPSVIVVWLQGKWGQERVEEKPSKKRCQEEFSTW